jgi:alpha-glucuronidase
MRDVSVRILREIRKKIGFAAIAPAFAIAAATTAPAQTAEQAWLKYSRVETTPQISLSVVALGAGAKEQHAAGELVQGLQGLFGRAELKSGVQPNSVIIGTRAEFAKHFPQWRPGGTHAPSQRMEIHDDFNHSLSWQVDARTSAWVQSFSIYRDEDVSAGSVFIEAPLEDGIVHGAFTLLRMIQSGQDVPAGGIHEQPAIPIRWVDEWDNADGSVERGYAGRSIFFDGGHVREDLKPVSEYARLLASVGINGCNINNVNNATVFLEPEMLKEVARIADAMRPWGVRVGLSVDIASPQKIGRLKTYDPVDPEVIAWWKKKIDEVYVAIPDLAGFTVKADSEGQPGPASYGRTPADAANVLANALSPHGGVVLYRAFVYNHHLDWKDPKADRARAAYDIFHPMDGKFAPNVIVQIKEGPIDFQAQEPVSPLFAGLEKTSSAMEVQITQEYLGQQRHLVYIAPMWKWVLDFDLEAGTKGTREQGNEKTRERARATPVKEIIAGKTFDRPLGGMVGVASVGQDGWLGSPLALANLYAFGRLAWDPNLTAEQIAEEWTRQTLGNDPEVVRTVTAMLMQSWPAYLHYTGPLGMQTLTDITGSHYGPNIEASENNGWGQWHRADQEGVGMDRSVATGTGYAGQYPPELAKKYEDVKTTPDELLTFFHHVPYTWKLQDGKTVIQYIYDSHYRGAEEAARLGAEWAGLKGKVDPAVFEKMQARLEYQAGHAIVWRDAIVQYFLKLSGIPDEKGRAGHYPGRLEAEDAKLTGYKVIDVQPWEDASGGKAVSCDEASCSAEWKYQGKAGRFDVAVQYFDLKGGSAKFVLMVNGKPAGAWEANAALPSDHPHGDNSIRVKFPHIRLSPGDLITVDGIADGADHAALDYIEVTPTAAAQ